MRTRTRDTKQKKKNRRGEAQGSVVVGDDSHFLHFLAPHTLTKQLLKKMMVRNTFLCVTFVNAMVQNWDQMFGFGQAMPGRFEKNYRCHSAAFVSKPELEMGGKSKLHFVARLRFHSCFPQLFCHLPPWTFYVSFVGSSHTCTRLPARTHERTRTSLTCFISSSPLEN